MSFNDYLSAEDIGALMDAFGDAGLMDATAQDALRSSLNPIYRYALRGDPSPRLQLFRDLNTMNREHNLRNGDVPLAQYLAAALVLAGERAAGDIIDEKLRRVRYTGAAPPSHATIMGWSAQGVSGAGLAVSWEAQTNAFDQTVGVRFLMDGVTAARSVVKILIHRHKDGEAEYTDGDVPRLVNGTAWFIAPDLLITNHHVVNARRKDGVQEPDASESDFRLQAESATLLFDYVDKQIQPAELKLGPGALVHADKTLDFALLRLSEAAAQRPPLRLRMRLIAKRVEQALGTGVNLLQHPNGDPMRLGFRNNYVIIGTPAALTYLTDTAVGSSGSPVCDDSWAVAALHSGSRRLAGADIEILGHKFTRENFGVPIPTVLSNVQQAVPEVHAEILGSQA